MTTAPSPPNASTIFNKVDFLGKLLPGYVAVIVSLFLFYPDLLSGLPREAENTSQQAESISRLIPFDIFLAVVFIVAGPAAGYILQTFHRNLYTIISWRSSSSRRSRKDVVNKYAKIISLCTNDEKQRLEEKEAEYDFSISTGFALLFIVIINSLYKSNFEIAIAIPLLALSSISFLGGLIDSHTSYQPLHDRLYDKYKDK